jgi:hypothetical protein
VIAGLEASSSVRDVATAIVAAVAIALLRLVWKLGERVTRLEALEEARRLYEPEEELDDPDEPLGELRRRFE